MEKILDLVSTFIDSVPFPIEGVVRTVLTLPFALILIGLGVSILFFLLLLFTSFFLLANIPLMYIYQNLEKKYHNLNWNFFILPLVAIEAFIIFQSYKVTKIIGEYVNEFFWENVLLISVFWITGVLFLYLKK